MVNEYELIFRPNHHLLTYSPLTVYEQVVPREEELFITLSHRERSNASHLLNHCEKEGIKYNNLTETDCLKLCQSFCTNDQEVMKHYYNKIKCSNKLSRDFLNEKFDEILKIARISGVSCDPMIAPRKINSETNCYEFELKLYHLDMRDDSLFYPLLERNGFSSSFEDESYTYSNIVDGERIERTAHHRIASITYPLPIDYIESDLYKLNKGEIIGEFVLRKKDEPFKMIGLNG